MREPFPGGFAIVGIGCRFPGAVGSPEQFWRLLCEGVDAITEIPGDRFDVGAYFDADPGAPGRLYARWGGFLSRIDAFDADFFAIAPREARRIDPQHRLLLEVMWEALEDGGQVPERLAGTRAGVFVGISSHDYGDIQVRPANRLLLDGHAFTAAAAFSAANRISRLLDVHGPSVAVDTACSSSLTAVHLACRSLRAGECDLALAGGVNLILNPEPIVSLCKGTLLSPDGRCKAFDARANGYVRGEGAGAVVLKPLHRALEAGDPIYAVIRGTAINQDGRTPATGIPSADSQAAMVREALGDAGLEPGAVQYVEAHGTGTAAGDPIEAEALGRVLGGGRSAERPCLVGSVKTNIGHLEAGAGIAGLIKAALALKHRQIPASLHFTEPNPAIGFEALRLRVPTTLEPWPATGGRAVAAVNSFGFGGANAHAVLEEAPTRTARSPTTWRSAHLLPVSGRSAEALRQLVGEYARRVRDDPTLDSGDLCLSAADRRGHHEHRLAVVGADREGLLEGLEAFAAGAEHPCVAAGRAHRGREPLIAFVFSGMGPQWYGMGRQLLAEEAVFRSMLEKCDRLLLPMSGWSLLEELGRSESDSRVADADLAHVANMAIQVSLSALWRSWGIEPAVVLGHSSGEMAAACASGALDLAEALHLAFVRGRLQHRLTGTGRMLAAGISPELALELVAGEGGAVSLAAVNAPKSVTLSGATPALERIATELQRRDLFCRILPVEVPYHSPSMETLREELLTLLRDLRPHQASTPFVSAVNARRMDGLDLDGGYWFRNLREPVQFAAALGRVLESGCEVLLEVGSHPVLAGSMRECLSHAGKAGLVLPTLRRAESERATMLRSLAAMYSVGQRISWREVCGPGSHVALPTYPWQRERHWVEEAPEEEAAARPPGMVESQHPLLGGRLRSPRPTWQADLGQARLDYLDGHVVGDGPVFPAAAFIEMALSAAREIQGEGALALEGVEFQRMLALAPGRRACVQISWDPERNAIDIHGSTDGREAPWARHAQARIAGANPGPAGCADFTAIRARCTVAVAVEAFYAYLGRRGLQYGGAFRSVRELWQGPGEALALVRAEQRSVPGASPADEGYEVHPALLDAAFQVIAAAHGLGAEGNGPDGPFLPVSTSRVTQYRRPGTSFWAHVALEPAEGNGVAGRVRLLDDSGAVLLDCEGFRTRAIPSPGPPAEDRIQRCLYRFGWEDVPLPTSGPTPPRAAPPGSQGPVGPGAPEATPAVLPSPSEILAAISAHQSPRSWSAQAYYDAIEPALDGLALALAETALRELGWDPAGANGIDPPSPDRLGVILQHRRLFQQLCEHVVASRKQRTAAAESPARLAEHVLELDPGYATEVELLMRCAGPLAEVLRGRVDPHELLMADGLELLGRFYRESPTMRFYNGLAAEALGAALATGREPVRVLEIGAGTGGLTGAVLPALRERTIEYAFTDVSPFFLARAREHFRDEPSIRPGLLDIEADPGAQGFTSRGFDLVLAANVLHGTADLRAVLGNVRRLLRPGGLIVLVEVTRRPWWIEPIFGQLEGWWRFADRQLRPSHALLAEAQWRVLLAEAGFEGPTTIADPAREGGTTQAVILARAPGMDAAALQHDPGDRRHWVLLTDRRGVATATAEILRHRGDRCTLVQPGLSGRPPGADRGVPPLDAGEMARMLEEARASGGRVSGILHFMNIDAPSPDAASAGEVMEAQVQGCESVLALVKALEREAAPPGLWVVTSGAQSVDGIDEPSNVLQAAVWGLARVVANEQPAIRCRLVDLGQSCGTDEVAALVAELFASEAEDEVALRGRRRLARRMRRLPLGGNPVPGGESVFRSPDETALTLEIGTKGALDSIALRESRRAEPGPGQVLIRVIAAGLNFRDVLHVLGMLPPGAEESASGRTGASECAGVLVACGEGVEGLRPGDEVVGLGSSAVGSYVLARSELVVSKPARLSFEEAATIPVAFLTAHYALDHLARVGAGDRVLIHSASGGVGLAAIQICKRASAEVFTTAGTEEKRAFLQSIGIEHVFDSRSLAFAAEVLRRTGGEGVDVVLNSLAGEALGKGLSLLRPGGRFVEIGKRDIYQNTTIGLLPFRKNLSFFALDLMRLSDERPALVRGLLRHIVGEVAEGSLSPLLHTSYGLSNAAAAYRLMAQARHIGKVVLTVRAARYRALPPSSPTVRPDATYLLTGGLGGFGLAVARWLVDHGARSLVLMSRSGEPKDDGAALAALRSTSAQVLVAKGDVAREEDVARVLGEIRDRLPPLRGVFHAAMVLEDGALGAMQPGQFRAVLSPKVAGAWNLHRLTANDDLDFLVFFSSLASVIGNPMQGNYAAANAFLDELAAYRRTHGKPALSISWGPLSGAGYVARHRDIGAYLDRLGLETFTPAAALEVLEHLLRRDVAHVVAANLDWRELANWNRTMAASARLLGPTPPVQPAPGASGSAPLLERLRAVDPPERTGLLRARILTALGRVLGTTAGRLDPDKPLTDLGLDSLMAMELLTGLKLDLPIQLGVVKLLRGMTAQDLATNLLAQVAPVLGDSAAPVAPEATPQEPAGQAADEPPTPGAGVSQVQEWPLSFEQGRIWFESRRAVGTAAYNLTGNARLRGRLDPLALRRAIGEVVRRNEVLRARFQEADGEPRQLIVPWSEPALGTVDLAGLPAAAREDEVRRLATSEVQRPFDLAVGPLLRATLLRLDAEEHVVLLTAHHIVTDAWGLTVLVREVMALYDALCAGRPSPLPDPPPCYADYVRRQRLELAGGALERHLAHWRRRLTRAPPALQLRMEGPPPHERTSRGGHVRFELPDRLSSALAGLGRSEGATAFMTLLAAFNVLLHRYSGADDLCVGTAVATRGGPGEDALVGCCMNTLVLRTDLSGDPSFRELLVRVKEGTLGDLAHQEAPFDQVVRALGPLRPQLYRAMLVLHNLKWPVLRMSGLTVSPLEAESETAVCDLMLLLDTGTPMRGTLEYSSDLFDAATAEQTVRHFLTLLEGAVTEPDRRISELSLVPEAEWRSLIAAGTGPTLSLEEPALLHRLFEEQVARTPLAHAVTDENGTLTYADLNDRAERLAARLGRRGVGVGVPVAVCVPRSAELVVGVLAILKAGGALAPLEPDHPRERLEFMLSDSGAGALLTVAALRRRLRSPVPVVLLDREEGPRGEDPTPVPTAPGELAYVLYTSGTTGQPKGVLVPHRAIVNQVRWRQSAFPLSPRDLVLQRTPIGFDPAIWEIFGPLSAGARLLMPTPAATGDVAALVRQLVETGVTTLQVVPAVLSALLDEPGVANCTCLARVFCGGDVLTRTLRERFFERLPWAELHNLYGPTEAAIDATFWTCRRGDPGEATPIGRPIANARVHVLGPAMQPVPTGIPGELWIGGAGVARGYARLPELTAQRFVADPFEVSGGRLYRTGDRGRVRSDGAIEYLGRMDDQVKLHGIRIEPGEIRALLSRHPRVHEAAVLAREVAPGERRLVAYLVAEPGRPPRSRELESYLRRFLPGPMVPRAFVRLDRLPRTLNGKLDAAALPVPRGRRGPGSRSVVAPRDDLELKLAGIWEELLDASPVGVTDDFFAQGGHSLLAARLAARVRAELGAELPLSQLLDSPTIEAMARAIRDRPRGPAARSSPLVTLQRGEGHRPIFLVHALTGSALCYLDLARRLGRDRPVRGLQAPALEGDRAPGKHLEEMAAEYVEAIRAVQPEGPYLLGGWSMGGVVAFEMARRLTDQGQELGLLVLIDAWALHPGDGAALRDASAALVRRTLQDLGLEPGRVAAPGETFWGLPPELQLERILERVRSGELLRPGTPAADLVGRRLQVAAAHAAALRDYVPRPYAGLIQLVRPERGCDGAPDAALGWRALAGGGVVVHTVPGEHDTMLRAPNVSRLARCLRQLLPAAEIRPVRLSAEVPNGAEAHP